MEKKWCIQVLYFSSLLLLLMENPPLPDWYSIVPKPISSSKLLSSTTLDSSMRVYPIQLDHNPIEILKFMCVQLTEQMEVIVVAQRGALICPNYKLTNLKNNICKIFSGKGTYC